MIAGDICTRSCRFCNTKTGRPAPLNPGEPQQVAESIRLMGLKHAVITSVDRDDLPDMGASHWAATIRAVKTLNPQTTIEALIPDFRGETGLTDIVIDASPEIISHNMETVRRLTPHIRSAARYEVSLAVLRHISGRQVTAKTGIMLGLGETESEVLELMDDVLQAGVRILTIGQYLQPSDRNIPVAAYIPPSQFEDFKAAAIGKGFVVVESGPLVRSSYYAEKHL
jgi:lipoic acid synthetase